MIKTILKEVIITLVLCIAILLVLGILFYDYNPLNKIVPGKIAYETPENIKGELQENEVKDVLKGGINIVYSIDSTDLNIYKKNKDYVAGKANPFAALEDTNTNVSGDGQAINKNNVETSNATNSNKLPEQTNTFLNTTGRK